MSLVLAVGTQRGGVTDAQYVVLTANATLTDERVLTETANRIVITDGGAGGAVTLSPGALIVQTDQANTWTVGSQIIQPAVDTTTAFQVFDADGGDPVLSVDTVNERVGIGTAAPEAPLDINGFGTALYGLPTVMVKDNVNAISGFQMYNANAGAAAEYRFAIADNAKKNYLAFTVGGSGNAQIRFGLNRNVTNYLFSQTLPGGTTRDFAIGLYDNKDLHFATNNVVRIIVKNSGLVGINQTSPGAQLQVDTSGAAVKGQIIKAAAAQTAALFQLQDSTGGVVVDSGDGLAASEWVHNEGGINIDFRVESQTYDALFVDASEDSIDIMHHASGKIGMYAVAPTTQAAHIADPAGGATVDAEARTAINAILVAIENIGITLAA